MLQRVLRLSELFRPTGLKRSAIYAKIAEGTFPKPIPLGPRAVGWLESEIAAWQTARIAERDNAQPERPKKIIGHGKKRPQYARRQIHRGEASSIGLNEELAVGPTKQKPNCDSQVFLLDDPVDSRDDDRVV
jgi:prophage regulatory protein